MKIPGESLISRVNNFDGRCVLRRFMIFTVVAFQSNAMNFSIECGGIPTGIFDPSNSELQYWPCQVREYWLTSLLPFAAFVRFLLTYVSSFVVVAGVTTNALSFFLLSASTLDDSVLALYLKALALSDIGALVFNYATSIARSNSTAFNDLFMSSKLLCILNSVLMEFFQFTSTWLLVCLTCARLHAVAFPLRKLKSSAALISVLVIGDLSLGVSLTKICHGGYEADSTFEFVPCVEKREKPWGSTMILYIALSTWLPLMFIFVGNALSTISMRQAARIRRRLTTQCAMQTNGTLLLVVTMVHLVLWLPLGIVESVELYWDVVMLRQPSTRDEREQQLYVDWLKEKLLLKWCRGLCFHLYHWSFAINFFLYCLTGKRFRDSASRMLFGVGA